MEVMESKRSVMNELIQNSSDKINFEPTNDDDFADEFLNLYQNYVQEQQNDLKNVQVGKNRWFGLHRCCKISNRLISTNVDVKETFTAVFKLYNFTKSYAL